MVNYPILTCHSDSVQHLPTEVYVQKKRERGHVTLTCNTSCPLTDPQTAYRWYRNKHIYRYSVGQHLLVSSPTDGSSFSCAVKGLEDVHSDEVCEYELTRGLLQPVQEYQHVRLLSQ